MRPGSRRVPLRRFAVVAALAAACAACAAGRATADEAPAAQPITLRWSAPGACPGEDAVRASVERLLGGSPQPSQRALLADGRVEVEGEDRLRLTLTLASGTSRTSRTLRSATCATLVEAGALLIALAFDPEAVAAEGARREEAPAAPAPVPPQASPAPTPEPPQASPPPQPPPVPPLAPREAQRTPAPRPRGAPGAPPAPAVGWGPLAAALLDVGSLPAPAPGVRVGLAIQAGAYRVEPLFEAWAASRATLAGRPGAGASLRLLVGAVRACRRLWPWHGRDARAAASACAGFELGEMHAEGFGVLLPDQGGALWAAPRAEARFELRLASWLALTADAGAAAPLDRRPFVLRLAGERTVAHLPAAASLRGAVGLAARF